MNPGLPAISGSLRVSLSRWINPRAFTLNSTKPRRNDLYLDLVRIFTVKGVVLRAAGVWMIAFIKNTKSLRPHPCRQFVDLRPGTGVEGEMIQADASAVEATLQIACLNKNQVSAVEPLAAAGRPVLVLGIAEHLEQRSPKAQRYFQG